MKCSRWTGFVGGLAIALVPCGAIADERGEDAVELLLETGRPLRVALDTRIKLKHVGQPVSGVLAEAVYSYDRVVLPAGSRVVGHVAKLDPISKGARLRGILRGDLTPPHPVTVQFDQVVLPDGATIPLETRVGPGIEGVTLAVAGASEKGKIQRAKEEIKHEIDQAVAPFRGPGKWERAKDWVVGRLPVHPQYLRRGTLYSAELLAPVDFGWINPTERARAGDAPAPDSVLSVRLVTPLSSEATPRGTPIQAVLTRPVFSETNRLLFPEGTELDGEVTFAKRARRLHRNGQLRFLFETVKTSEGEAESLLASLHSIQVGGGAVAVDDEGGTSATGSGARFVAPSLALLAVRGSLGHRDRDDFTGARPDGPSADPGAEGVGGFIGLSALGSALAQTSRPVAVGLSVLGFVRTGYGAIFGRGREVVIPADTPMALQVAPKKE
jgi:hypothetical protein